MKHLPVIFITLSIILSVIACILPNWAIHNQKGSINDIIAVDTTWNYGLFNTCQETHSVGADANILQPNKCTPPTPNGHGILPSQIFSIAGPVLLAISAALCGMGQHKNRVLASLITGIICLTTTLVIFAASYAPSIKPGCINGSNRYAAGTYNLGCPVLSTSWYLELGAVVLAIVGVVIKARSSRKK